MAVDEHMSEMVLVAKSKMMLTLSLTSLDAKHEN